MTNCLSLMLILAYLLTTVPESAALTEPPSPDAREKGVETASILAEGGAWIWSLRSSRFGTRNHDLWAFGGPADSNPADSTALPPFAIAIHTDEYLVVQGPYSAEGHATHGLVQTAARLSDGTLPWHGRVVDAEGKGVEGVVLRYSHLGDLPLPEGLSKATETTSGEEGEFRLPRANVEHVSVEVFPSGSDRSVSIHVDVEGGATTVRLPSLLQLRGTVLDKSGSPVAGSVVLARSAGNGYRCRATNDGDRRGRFSVKTCTGITSIRVSALGYSQAVVEGALLWSSLGRPLILSREAILVGSVDAHDGPVLAQLYRGGTSAEHAGDLVDEDFLHSQFRFDRLASGVYHLHLRSPEIGWHVLGPISLREGEQRELGVVTAPRGSILSGSATDTDGRPLPDLRVRLLLGPYSTVAPSMLPEDRTDSAGRFRLSGLRPTARVEFYSPGRFWWIEEVPESVIDSGEEWSAFLPHLATQVRGTIPNIPGGELVALVLPESSDGLLFPHVDRVRRSFTFRGLPEGRFQLAQLGVVTGQRLIEIEEGMAGFVRPFDQPLQVLVKVSGGTQPWPGVGVRLVREDEVVHRGDDLPTTNREGAVVVTAKGAGTLLPYLTIGDLMVPAPPVEFRREEAAVSIRLPRTRCPLTAIDAVTREPVRATLELSREPASGDARGHFDYAQGRSEDGKFEILGLSPGSYRTVLTAPGYQRHVLVVQLVEGTCSVPIEVEMSRG